MDTVFDSELRNKVGDEKLYLSKKLTFLTDKLTKLDFNDTLLDLGGGTVFQQKQLIDFLKHKSVSIIFYDVPFDEIIKRFKIDATQIKKRRFLTNKVGIPWQITLLEYYNRYVALKQYADYVVDFHSGDSIENFAQQVQIILDNL